MCSSPNPWLEAELAETDREPRRQTYSMNAQHVHNIEVVLPGLVADSPTVVVGAHYDSAIGTPGANDNATGVAVLLELTRRFAGSSSPLEVVDPATGRVGVRCLRWTSCGRTPRSRSPGSRSACTTPC